MFTLAQVNENKYVHRCMVKQDSQQGLENKDCVKSCGSYLYNIPPSSKA